MEKENKLLDYYNDYQEKIKSLEADNTFPKSFYDSYYKGENKVYQKYIKEVKEFDEEWITTLESYLPSLNKIISNPKQALKVEDEVVAIEKVKKVSTQSIKHLSQNAHLIREVDADDFVIPRRLLTHFFEIDQTIYENRFIMTLIDRIYWFVNNRFKLISKNIRSYETKHFNLNSNFPVNETEVNINLDVTFTDELLTKRTIDYNRILLRRIAYLNRIATNLFTSPFMGYMKNQAKVVPPILKTNIITKDVNYKNCYLLWLFLDRYNTLAFTTNRVEKNLMLDDLYLEDVSAQALSIFTLIANNQQTRVKDYSEIESKGFRRKSIKQVRSHPDDYIVTDTDLKVEEHDIIEYYFEAIKRRFTKNLREYRKVSKSEETALKRALRETINITNTLYESHFDIEENTELFKTHVSEIAIKKELSKSKEKLKLAKYIREVKQVDYNNSLRHERKLLNEIKNYESLFLQEVNLEFSKSKTKLNTQKRLERSVKMNKLKAKEKTKILNDVKKHSEAINKERIFVNERLSIFKSIKRIDHAEELSKLRKKLNEENEVVLRKTKKEFQSKRRITNNKLKKELEQHEQKLKTELTKIKNAHEAKLKKDKEKLINSNKLKLKLNIDEIIKKYHEDKKNAKILEKSKSEIDLLIEQYKKSVINNED